MAPLNTKGLPTREAGKFGVEARLSPRRQWPPHYPAGAGYHTGLERPVPGVSGRQLPGCKREEGPRNLRSTLRSRPAEFNRVRAETKRVFLTLQGTFSSLLVYTISESRKILTMDSDIKKLTMLLIYQLLIFSMLECIASAENAIFWGIGNIFVA